MKNPPFQIRTILYPTDFSKSSEAVAPHVAALARAIHAQVCLLSVVPWPLDWHGASEPHFVVGDRALAELEKGRKDSEALCLKKLETIQQQHFTDLVCDVCVKSGAVAESIVESAESIQANLIMMATRGQGSPRPFLIGSVTAKVLHDAHCPIWTSPHPTELGPFRLYRQVICALDYRLPAGGFLSRAKEVAELFQSRLSFVTAIPRPGNLSPFQPKSVHLLKEETVSSLRHLLKELQIHGPLHVLEGSEGEVIRQAAVMEDADLVVIGRGHLDEQMGQLRTHAYEIIWNSPCPVLSL